MTARQNRIRRHRIGLRDRRRLVRDPVRAFQRAFWRVVDACFSREAGR